MVVALNKPSKFKAGSSFEYSQIGYDLLAKILENTTKKSFSELSMELFKSCGMKDTFHPDVMKYKHLVQAYSEMESGEIVLEKEILQNFPAAGSFISTVNDLNQWNECLFNGKILHEETLKILTSKQEGAIRNHPIFGYTEYGYGITLDTKEDILQLGQTGFAPGFVSMNFYFPMSQTSVIILQNVAYYPSDFKLTFYYHTEILKLLKGSIINKQ